MSSLQAEPALVPQPFLKGQMLHSICFLMPSPELAPACQCLSCLRSPKCNATLQTWSNKHWEENFLRFLVVTLFTQPKVMLILIIARVHSWLILIHLCLPERLGPFPQSSSVSRLSPACINKRFFLLNFMRSVLAHASSLSRFLWMQFCLWA